MESTINKKWVELFERALTLSIPDSYTAFKSHMRFVFKPLLSFDFDLNKLSELHLTSLPLINEVTDRMQDFLKKNKKYNSDRYLNMINKISSILSVESFSESLLDDSLRYPLAIEQERLLSNIIFYKMERLIDQS